MKYACFEEVLAYSSEQGVFSSSQLLFAKQLKLIKLCGEEP